MKVLLLVGDSGVGKTTIAKELCKNDKYNYIASYTDREKRFDKEWGHVFVTKDFMSEILVKDDIVASTKIGDTNYCALKSQFMNDAINVYIVDEEGMNKTIKNLPDADIVTILVTKEDVDVPEKISYKWDNRAIKHTLDICNLIGKLYLKKPLGKRIL